MPQSSCLCEVCENAFLLAKGINIACNIRLPTNPHHLIEGNACNSDSRSCVCGECDECVTNDFEKERTNENTSSEVGTDKENKKAFPSKTDVVRITRFEKSR